MGMWESICGWESVELTSHVTLFVIRDSHAETITL